MKTARYGLILFLITRPASASGPEPTGPVVVPQRAAREQTRPVRPIWDYREDLELSDRQVAVMKRILADFQRNALAARERFLELEGRLERLIDQGAPLHLIRSTLQKRATLEVDMRYEDILTSRRIIEVMNPEQAARWRTVQQRMRDRDSRSSQ